MIKLQISKGEQYIKFKSKFSELTVLELRSYMAIQKYIELILQSWEQLEYSDDIILSGKQLDVLRSDLFDQRMELLELLCEQPKRLEKQLKRYVLDYDTMNTIMNALANHFGHFTEFWEQCPLVKSFRYRFTRYEVHNIGSNTVQRDKIASFRLQKAFDDTNAIGADNWGNVVAFIATIIRPKKQVKEIGFTNTSFIKGKELKGYSPSDAHAYYLQQLEKQIEQQTPIAEQMKCNVAIGIIKYYWQKKKN